MSTVLQGPCEPGRRALQGFEQQCEPWSPGSSKLNYLCCCAGRLVVLISILGKGCSLAVLPWNLRESSTAPRIDCFGNRIQHLPCELALPPDKKPSPRPLPRVTGPGASFPLASQAESGDSDEMARAKAGQVPGPKQAAPRGSWRGITRGPCTVSEQCLSRSGGRNPEAGKPDSTALLFGSTVCLQSQPHSQMTRTSQAGSPHQPRKTEVDAWSHTEVRGPDLVILNPRSGASDTQEEALEGRWRSTRGLRPNWLHDLGHTYLLRASVSFPVKWSGDDDLANIGTQKNTYLLFFFWLLARSSGSPFHRYDTPHIPTLGKT